MANRTFVPIPGAPAPSTAKADRPWPELGVRRLVLVALVILLVGLFVLSLTLGSVSIPLKDIITVLTGGEPARASWRSIVLNHRLPKALTASLAGAALATAGLQMQTLFRNPLAGPFVLGINAGASLGVALVVLSVGVAGGSATLLLASLGLAGDFGVVFAASAGAALVMGLVLLISRRVHGTTTLLIIGMMIGYATGAFVSVLLYFSIAEFIQVYINWTFGSFGGVTWAKMEAFAPALIAGLGIAYVLAKPLNALLLGEDYARSMGLNTRRARFWIIISASLLAGAVTAFCGPIGFIGIAVPHLCRSLLNTSDHHILMPTVTLMGAALALLADLIAGMPGSQIVLPLNAVTSLIGAPIVIWVILRQPASSGAFAR
jgi:iron complex transport system permease protein